MQATAEAEALESNRKDVPDDGAAAPGGEAVGTDNVAPTDAVESVSAEAASAEIHDRWLRLAAEFDNYRKRNAREWQEQKQRAAAEVLLEMLEVADNLERAMAAAEDVSPLRKGVELTYQQLQAALKRFGVEALEAAGEAFDPTRHEAMLLVDSQDVESHHIVDVVRRGYSMHGEVLRPARVTVAR